MPTTVEQIRERLRAVRVPGFRHDVIRSGVVHDVQLEGDEVAIVVFEASRRMEKNEELRGRIARAVNGLPGVRSVRIATAAAHQDEAAGESSAEARSAIPGIARILAVSSCKGGVGKSTVAVNLALALRERGWKVGLLDSDVYGPSIPLMLGIEGKPEAAGGKVLPVSCHGLETISMGYFLDDRSPVVWRGPMVMSLVRQFLHDVAWGELDVLVIDMPPGTGDAALTLAQLVPVTGAIIVTTPQSVALRDVERGIGMFSQVHVPVLGVVENMTSWVCPCCGEEEAIFGSGGGDELESRFGTPVLARLPLDPRIREGGDRGAPIVLEAEGSPVRERFLELADSVQEMLGGAPAVDRSPHVH